MSKSLRMAVAAIAMAFLAVLAFSSTAGAQESSGNQAYVSALDRAFGDAAAQIVNWTGTAI